MRFLILTLTLICSGCMPGGRWTDSGIPKLLDNEELILKARPELGVTIVRRDGGLRSQEAFRRTLSHRLKIKLEDGSQEDFAKSYEAALRQEIVAKGATIHCSPRDGVAERDWSGEDFGFEYSWRGNDGFLYVTTFSTPTDDLYIVSHCYEYRSCN